MPGRGLPGRQSTPAAPEWGSPSRPAVVHLLLCDRVHWRRSWGRKLSPSCMDRTGCVARWASPSSGIIRAVPDPRGGTAVTTTGLTFTMATLSSPDPPALAHFYARLLAWEVETEEPGWVTLCNPAG